MKSGWRVRGEAVLRGSSALGLGGVTGQQVWRESVRWLASVSAEAVVGEMRETGVMRDLANSYAFWIFVFVALVAIYLLPTLIGMVRNVDRLALVFLVNLIGAPTGIGWLAAMILAFGPRRVSPEPQWSSYPAGMRSSTRIADARSLGRPVGR
jgi:hypothetical protein